MDAYIGQLMFAGFNFAPQGWAFCDGSLMQISQNDALFALIGTTFGGDGVNTFALPDLRGRVPVHQATNYVLGSTGGAENVTINNNQYPQHTHPLVVTAANGNANSAGNNALAAGQPLYGTAAPATAMNSNAVSTAPGGNSSHSNLQPSLVANWVIALEGIFPTQN
jgi:microcystin-dependent protein